MTHRHIYSVFQQNFTHLLTKPLIEWFENGKNSIRLRDRSGKDYVFTYNTPDDWCFETVESFITRLRGRTKM